MLAPGFMNSVYNTITFELAFIPISGEINFNRSFYRFLKTSHYHSCFVLNFTVI